MIHRLRQVGDALYEINSFQISRKTKLLYEFDIIDLPASQRDKESLNGLGT